MVSLDMLLTIHKWPNPVLELPALPVQEFDPALRTLVSNMAETMLVRKGLGLAAPQVGVPLRVFVRALKHGFAEFVNPVIEQVALEQELLSEGCLSLPGIHEAIARPSWVSGYAFSVEGVRFDFHLKGLEARCVLHEMEHLDGKVMLEHLNRVQRRAAEKKLRTPGRGR